LVLEKLIAQFVSSFMESKDNEKEEAGDK
jgi:hypothetical protein